LIGLADKIKIENRLPIGRVQLQRAMFCLGIALFVLVGAFALPQGLNFLASGLSDWQRNFRLFKFFLFLGTFISLAGWAYRLDKRNRKLQDTTD